MNQITTERIALIRQIHEAAKAKKLSLSDLSELTAQTGRRIPPAELSRAFNHKGNLRIETLLRLAHAAGCRVKIEKDDAVGHGI